MTGIGEIAQIAASSAIDQGYAMANMAGLGSTEAQAFAVDTVMNAPAYQNSIGEGQDSGFSTYNQQGSLGGQIVSSTFNQMNNFGSANAYRNNFSFNKGILETVYG